MCARDTTQSSPKTIRNALLACEINFNLCSRVSTTRRGVHVRMSFARIQLATTHVSYYNEMINRTRDTCKFTLAYCPNLQTSPSRLFRLEVCIFLSSRLMPMKLSIFALRRRQPIDSPPFRKSVSTIGCRVASLFRSCDAIRVVVCRKAIIGSS